jgi:N-methylhydantoinase A
MAGTGAAVIGVDVGGTFTDTVIIDGDGRAVESKALTTRDDLVRGIMASIDAGAAKLGEPTRDVLARTLWISHGTTVGLNALLTHTGATVGFLTTAGFEGVLPIARLNYIRGIRPEDRTEMRRWEKPELLVDRSRIAGIPERIDAAGRVLEPLDEDAARAAIRRLGDLGVEAIAVCLLWSIENPSHERRIGELVAEELPGVFVTLSSDISSRMGEYERGISSVLNSYVGPLFDRYLASLETELHNAGFTGRLYGMQMDGGVQPAERLRTRALTAISSGPVGGLFATQRIGRLLGHENIVATDVGGTSFDVGLVVGGLVPMSPQPRIDRYELATPVADVVSIGTGGGSIARLDPKLGRLLVGPESAGASPGPVCYGRGGSRPTVTDAAAVLGYISHAGRDLVLDASAARDAIDREIAGPLGISAEEAADGILRVASSQMADLVRRVTILRGYDLSQFALYAYGGAAPQYAGRYGGELGASAVVIPRLAAVLSAFGVAVSDLQTSVTRDLVPTPLHGSLDAMAGVLADLEASAHAELDASAAGAGVEPQMVRLAGLRFARQVEEIDVLLPPGPVTPVTLEQLEKEFRTEYERLVGRGTTLRDTAIELVTLTVRLRVPLRPDDELWSLSGEEGDGPAASRSAWFAGTWVDCPVVPLAAVEQGVGGPALIELSTTTVVVYPEQRAELDRFGNVVLHLGAERP